MKIPQRYKHTEFGLIPDDWVLCTFKDVLTTFSSGATPYRGIPNIIMAISDGFQVES